jgi:WD40 repeat protein
MMDDRTLMELRKPRRILGFGPVSQAAWSPDGSCLAVAGAAVHVLETRTWQVVRTLFGHRDLVTSVTFSPDGRLLATASCTHIDDRGCDTVDDSGRNIACTRAEIKLWEVTSFREVRTLEGQSGRITAMALSPDGQLLACASYRRAEEGEEDFLSYGQSEIRVWEIATGRERYTLPGYLYEKVRSVAFDPERRWLAAAFEGGVRFWEVTTGREVRILPDEVEIRNVRSVALSPDGRRIALGVDRPDGYAIELWDLRTRRRSRTFCGRGHRISSVAFHPEGALLASGSRNVKVEAGEIVLWEVRTGREIYSLSAQITPVESVAFSPDGRLLAAGTGWPDYTVQLWEASTGRRIRALSGHSGIVESVAFHPKGGFLTSGSWDGTVKLWEAATGRDVYTFAGHRAAVTSVAFHPEGALLASGSWDGTVRLWDVATGKTRHILRGHSGWIRAIAFSPEGALLASASDDGTVRLWEATTGREVRTLRGRSHRAWSVAFSPDGRWIAYGSCGDKGVSGIRLWQVSTGREVRSLRSRDGAMNSLAFRPDGTLLAGGSQKEIQLWEAATGRLLPPFRGHRGTVTSVAFSPDGQLLASGSRDGTVRVWKVEEV